MKKTFLFVVVVMALMAPLAAQGVKVVLPNGGESWALHSSQAITWTSTNPGSQKVDIILRNTGGKVGPIKSQVALSLGSWQWQDVGRLEDGTMAPQGSDYIVRIRDAANTFGDSSDAAFTISGTQPVIVKAPPFERIPPQMLKFSRLEISGVGLAPNADGYAITFKYKNVGNAALPKASEVPVKPDFLVQLDYRDMAKGSLYIPAFPAQPGWEQIGFNGGQVVFPDQPAAGSSFKENDELFRWSGGSNIFVQINGNKVMNMESHKLWQKVEPLALECYYDLICQGVWYDWQTRMLSILVKVDGRIPTNERFKLVCISYAGYGNDYQPGRVQYQFTQAMNERSFSFSKIVDLPPDATGVKFEVFVVGIPGSPRQKVNDFMMRNNMLVLRCRRGDDPCVTAH